VLVPARSERDELCTDYGLILSLANPFSQPSSGHQALAFAGYYGQGTLAAAQYATYKDFVNHDLVRSRRAVECLVTADIVDGAPRLKKSVVRRSCRRDCRSRSRAYPRPVMRRASS
jgi:hypothetical protein